jgi:hypothetical protein
MRFLYLSTIDCGGVGSVLIYMGVLGFGAVLMNSVGIGMATLLILWRSMAADKVEKLVPARSCAFHDLNKGARQP